MHIYYPDKKKRILARIVHDSIHFLMFLSGIVFWPVVLVQISIVTTILLNTLLLTNCDDLRCALVTQFLGDDDDDDDDDGTDERNENNGNDNDEHMKSNKKRKDCPNERQCRRTQPSLSMFKTPATGVNSSLMMTNYTKQWISLSAV